MVDLLMLALQATQCVATITVHSVFYWQKGKIIDSVYSMLVTVAGEEFKTYISAMTLSF